MILAATRRLIAKLIADALSQIDQSKALLVQRAIDALDGDAMGYILEFAPNPFHGPDSDERGGSPNLDQQGLSSGATSSPGNCQM